MADTPVDVPHAEGGEDKKMSKRAMEKEAKKAAAKAAKLAKKAEVVIRGGKDDASSTSSKQPTSVFAEGWLRKTYESRKCDQVRTRFPPEPNGFLHIGHGERLPESCNRLYVN